MFEESFLLHDYSLKTSYQMPHAHGLGLITCAGWQPGSLSGTLAVGTAAGLVSLYSLSPAPGATGETRGVGGSTLLHNRTGARPFGGTSNSLVPATSSSLQLQPGSPPGGGGGLRMTLCAPPFHLPGRVNCLAWSPCGKYLATGDGPRLRVWERKAAPSSGLTPGQMTIQSTTAPGSGGFAPCVSMSRTRRRGPNRIISLLWDPTSSRIAVTKSWGAVEVWDCFKAEVLFVTEGFYTAQEKKSPPVGNEGSDHLDHPDHPENEFSDALPGGRRWVGLGGNLPQRNSFLVATNMDVFEVAWNGEERHAGEGGLFSSQTEDAPAAALEILRVVFYILSYVSHHGGG